METTPNTPPVPQSNQPFDPANFHQELFLHLEDMHKWIADLSDVHFALTHWLFEHCKQQGKAEKDKPPIM